MSSLNFCVKEMGKNPYFCRFSLKEKVVVNETETGFLVWNSKSIVSIGTKKTFRWRHLLWVLFERWYVISSSCSWNLIVKKVNVEPLYVLWVEKEEKIVSLAVCSSKWIGRLTVVMKHSECSTIHRFRKL